jgi:hypothetical protein
VIGISRHSNFTTTAQQQQIRGYSEQTKPIPDHWSEVTEPSHDDQGE